MKWFRENQFLGGLLVALLIGIGVAGYLLLTQKSAFDAATAQHNEIRSELNRLQGLAPYPNEANYQKMKTQSEEYATALGRFKQELKARMLPAAPLAPNEFQNRLRQAVAAVQEKARASQVKLPENFYLGFNEFAGSLPGTATAPLLGQQLDQITFIVNLLIDARVDSIAAVRRGPLAEERGAGPSPPPSPAARPAKPGATPAAASLIDRSTVETTFVSTPAALRKILNQLASAQEQFLIVRTLHVRSEKDKGPPREQTPDAAGPGNGSAPASGESKPGGGANLNFIVGTEKIQTSAKIEIVRFIF